MFTQLTERAPSRAFQAGFLLALVFWLLCAEIFCRVGAAGLWYRHFDFSGRLVSLPELRDRLAYFTRRPATVCLLGDSVAGASALIENRIPNAEQSSLTRRLQAHFEAQGRQLFSLSADGLLIPDMESIATEFDGTRPETVLILLNYRMFAPEFQTGGAASRTFLTHAATPGNADSSLGATIEALAHRYSALFRSTQLLKTLWYFPSQKDFFQQQLEHWFPNPRDTDLAEAALMLKVAPYYRNVEWQTDSAAFRSLGRVLDHLHTLQIPARIVFTPQNTTVLHEMLSPESFRRNRALLDEFVHAHTGTESAYFDWAERYPSRSFLDHCHLTRDGNDRYAQDLVDLLLGRVG